MKDERNESNSKNQWIVVALQSIGFDFKQFKSQAAKVNLASELIILVLLVVSYLATKGETIALYICSIFRPELIDRVNKQTSNTGLIALVGFGVVCFAFVFFVKPYLENKKILPPDFKDE